MDVETYEQMPEFLDVRELRVHVQQPGFRTEALIVVTTLTDHQTYSSQEVPRCTTNAGWSNSISAPSRSVSASTCYAAALPTWCKEIWSCLLAYDLIRKTILEAAYAADVSPRQLSFTAAMQAIGAGWTAVLLLDEAGQTRLIDLYLHDLVGYEVGHRPNRIEPRRQAASETPTTARQTAPAARRDTSLVAGRRPH